MSGRWTKQAIASHRGGTFVGFKMFHTMGDSDRATRQIDTEINALVDSVHLAMGVIPSTIRNPWPLDESVRMANAPAGSPDKAKFDAWRDRILAAKTIAQLSPLWGFWEEYVSPTYTEWTQFRDHDNEYYNLFTSWDEYDKWLERVRQLREKVKAKKIDVETPAPVDLTKTIPGAIADKAAEAAMELATIAKWGLIGALALGGVVALGSLGHSLKSGRDPFDTYRKSLTTYRGG